MGHKFEIFTAGCDLCKTAIDILKENICEKCSIVEYSLHNPLTKDVEEKIKLYDIKAVPSIVVDEKLRFQGIPNKSEIEEIISDVI